MKTVTVRLPRALRVCAGDQAQLRVQVSEASVGGLLAALAEQHPELAARLVDEQGQLRRQVTLYNGDEDVRLTGRSASLSEDVQIVVPITL